MPSVFPCRPGRAGTSCSRPTARRCGRGAPPPPACASRSGSARARCRPSPPSAPGRVRDDDAAAGTRRHVDVVVAHRHVGDDLECGPAASRNASSTRSCSIATTASAPRRLVQLVHGQRPVVRRDPRVAGRPELRERRLRDRARDDDPRRTLSRRACASSRGSRRATCRARRRRALPTLREVGPALQAEGGVADELDAVVERVEVAERSAPTRGSSLSGKNVPATRKSGVSTALIT